MPWCPDCKTEYEEGYENCSDCGVKLVDENPQEGNMNDGNDNPELLITVADGMQADILESKLKFYGIPVMRKHRETGALLTVYMGASPFGVDLYVPSELLENARKLINQEIDANGGESYDENSIVESQENTPEGLEGNNTGDTLTEADNKDYRSVMTRRLANWLLLIFLVPGLIWFLIFLIKYLAD